MNKAYKFLLIGIVGLIILAIFAAYKQYRYQLADFVLYLREYQYQRGKIIAHRENTTKENFPKWERINEFIYNGWEFKIGETEAEIRKNLGVPEIEERIYKFGMPNGLYIEVVGGADEEGKVDKVLISKVILDASSEGADKYKMKWGLNIGSSKKRVKEVLGEPYKITVRKGWIPNQIEKEEEIWTYSYIEGAGSTVKFYFIDDIIHRIEWELYTG